MFTPSFVNASLCTDYYLMIFQVIRPYIPYQEPRLSAALYEVVLNVLMGEDCKVYIRDTDNSFCQHPIFFSSLHNYISCIVLQASRS